MWILTTILLNLTLFVCVDEALELENRVSLVRARSISNRTHKAHFCSFLLRMICKVCRVWSFDSIALVVEPHKFHCFLQKLDLIKGSAQTPRSHVLWFLILDRIPSCILVQDNVEYLDVSIDFAWKFEIQQIMLRSLRLFVRVYFWSFLDVATPSKA